MKNENRQTIVIVVGGVFILALLIAIIILAVVGFGQSEEQIKCCKYEGCDETDIYAEGYCRYHYFKSIGQNILDQEGGIDKEIQDSIIESIPKNDAIEGIIKNKVND